MAVSSTFKAGSGEGYDQVMGRWSARLAEVFLDFSGGADGEDILDAGCGTGSLTSALSRRIKARSITGVDFSPIYVDYASAAIRDPRITFKVGESPRVYVERINIQGNTVTRDKVIRREFRLNEGDAFNAFKVKRSQDRIQSLGFFQENLEIKQAQGSSNDRVVLNLDVEEKSTGELQLSAGYSSLEGFILSASVAQRNFMGKGQQLQTGISYSKYSKSISAGFTEPYLFDKSILLGGEIFYQDYNSFNFVGNERNQTYGQNRIGGVVRVGFPVTEFVSFGARYSLSQDDITLDEDTFFEDVDNDPDTPDECSPRLAGRYLCQELGKHLTSLVGYNAGYDDTNGIRATRGQRIILSQDFAGLGGDVKYIRSRLDATKYFLLPKAFVLSIHAEGGYIHPLEKSEGDGQDPIRISDRFFGPQMRGFDIRGIGPRVERRPYDSPTELDNSNKNVVSDALGGRAYYMGRLEIEFPSTSALKNLGIRPSAFGDVFFGSAMRQSDDLEHAVDVARKELAERKAPRPVMSIGASIADRLKSLRRKGSGKVVAAR